VRIALGLEYDGSSFCGWQSQLEGCSVQDALERALADIAGHEVATVASGRTDSGVHALHQVVHADVFVERPLTAWVRGVNALLPDAMAVLWAREVADDFHARFSARERSYRYVLCNRAVRPALLSTRVGWYHALLQLAPMQEAARNILGRHDFSAFRAAECQAKTPLRELRALDITAHGELIVFEFSADAFLQHMVRNIVGSLVYVGSGRHAPHWLREVLEARDRSQAAPTFSATGLYLSAVKYDAAWNLPDKGDAFPDYLQALEEWMHVQ
jgi:tRNA pseudouridine38-40 synthase